MNAHAVTTGTHAWPHHRRCFSVPLQQATALLHGRRTSDADRLGRLAAERPGAAGGRHARCSMPRLPAGCCAALVKIIHTSNNSYHTLYWRVVVRVLCEGKRFCWLALAAATRASGQQVCATTAQFRRSALIARFESPAGHRLHALSRQLLTRAGAHLACTRGTRRIVTRDHTHLQFHGMHASWGVVI